LFDSLAVEREFEEPVEIDYEEGDERDRSAQAGLERV